MIIILIIVIAVYICSNYDSDSEGPQELTFYLMAIKISRFENLFGIFLFINS